MVDNKAKIEELTACFPVISIKARIRLDLTGVNPFIMEFMKSGSHRVPNLTVV
jgi:hypothetical protein